MTEVPASTEKPLILVVDDESQNLGLVRRSLRRRYRIELAESGEQALQQLGRLEAPAVVLADMRMPGMNGAELLATCVERIPRAKRLLMTGYTDYSALMEAVNRGKIHATIQKPFEPSLLEATVDSVVQLHELERHNEHLMGELESSNEQLRAANKMLEKSLEERGANLLRRMQDAVEMHATLRNVRERDAVTGLLGDLPFARRLEAELRRARAHGEPLTLITVQLCALERELRRSRATEAQDALGSAGRIVREALAGEDPLRPAIAGRVSSTKVAVAFPIRTTSECAPFADRLERELSGSAFGADVSVLALESKEDWCTGDLTRDPNDQGSGRPGEPPLPEEERAR